MILGFTGTLKGISRKQEIALTIRMARLAPSALIHGGAVGADTTAHRIALIPPRSVKRIDVYPCSVSRFVYWGDMECPRDILYTVYTVKKPLVRNRIIAKACNHLIACPRTVNETLRSGTWATVRYAIAAGKPVTIINPDGTSYIRDPTPRDAAPSDTVGDLFVR